MYFWKRSSLHVISTTTNKRGGKKRPQEGHPNWGGRCLPEQFREWSMCVSKAVIRHAELIKNWSSDDRVHMWQEDKRSWVLLSLFALPKDPVLISHSACYIFSPNGDHRTSLNSFSNFTVKVSRRLWLADVDLCATRGNIMWVVLGIQNTAEGFGNTQKCGEGIKPDVKHTYTSWLCHKHALWVCISQVISLERSFLSYKMRGDGLCYQESFHLEQSHLHPCSLATRLRGCKAPNLSPPSSALC